MNDTKTGLATRLFHSAKDLVWQDDAPVRSNRQSAMVNAEAATESPAMLTATRAVTQHVDEIPETGMSKELFALVMERPTAYSALAEAIAALAELPLDEATRYRSAFAVLRKTQQRTVEQVMQAITTHMDVLVAEQSRFSSQSHAAEEAEIHARLQEVKALGSAITQGRQQIEQLRNETEQRISKVQEDLERKQLRAAELEREADMRKKAIEKTVQDFTLAANTVKARLEADQLRISQHLATSATNA
ncbi:hypothetical protein ACO0K9_10695 [Undibacterium sp. Ji50W]|uniref:hypothetical protein n=1 Tax=Undibacterium sp. Ji50W TaxID=3413041 RepID=UPI003BF00823